MLLTVTETRSAVIAGLLCSKTCHATQFSSVAMPAEGAAALRSANRKTGIADAGTSRLAMQP